MSRPLLDRRALLQGLGATAAFGMSAASYARIRGANDRLNVGVMGLNGRGQAIVHAFNATPGAQVTDLADVDATVLAQRAGDFLKQGQPAARAVRDYRALLDRRDIDVIAVTTPDHWHAKAAADAMDAGKHVYVEKPLGMAPAEGELLMAIQKRTGRVLQMGNQQRSSAETRQLVERVRAGELGEIYQAQTWYANARRSIGRGVEQQPPPHLDWDLWQGPRPRAAYRSNLVHYNWHWFWHYGTGELCNNALHELDVARWLMDVEYPERVHARGARRFDLGDWEMYDTMDLELIYAGGRTIRWDGHSVNGVERYGRGRGVLVYGTKGSAIVDRNGYEIYDLAGKATSKVEAPEIGATTDTVGSGPLDRLHATNFAETIRGIAKEQASPVRDGHVSTTLCHLGNIAYRTGENLTLDPKSGRPSSAAAMKLWGVEYEQGWAIRT
jgi:predicted dehydrogenase